MEGARNRRRKTGTRWAVIASVLVAGLGLSAFTGTGASDSQPLALRASIADGTLPPAENLTTTVWLQNTGDENASLSSFGLTQFVYHLRQVNGTTVRIPVEARISYLLLASDAKLGPGDRHVIDANRTMWNLTLENGSAAPEGDYLYTGWIHGADGSSFRFEETFKVSPGRPGNGSHNASDTLGSPRTPGAAMGATLPAGYGFFYPRWTEGDMPVAWVYNPTDEPTMDGNPRDAISDGMTAWSSLSDRDTYFDLSDNGDDTNANPLDQTDGLNTVGWQDLSDGQVNTLARSDCDPSVASGDFEDAYGKTFNECDAYYDPDDDWSADETPAPDEFDLQGEAAHETGHW